MEFWTRRRALKALGGGAAFAQVGRVKAHPPDAAGPMARIDLHIFIPAPAVSYAGRIFGGGTKVAAAARLDLGSAGPASLRVDQRRFGATEEYGEADVAAVAGKPSWYRILRPGARPKATATQTVSDETLALTWALPEGATHGLKIVVNGRNPLVTGAPAIDATFTLGLRVRAGRLEYLLDCEHDGFPSYRLDLNGLGIRDYDGSTDTPLALFPPMERRYSTGWLAV